MGLRSSESSHIHVLAVGSRSILVIGGDVHLGSRRDGNILIAVCITSSDLGAFGVKSNGDLTSLLDLLSLSGIVNDGLVVFVGTVGEVHADDIET